MSQDKEIRALYLKGIMAGKKAKIELTTSIGGRNENEEYIHVAEKGDIVEATMANDGWIVDTSLGPKKIPLAQGRVR